MMTAGVGAYKCTLLFTLYSKEHTIGTDISAYKLIDWETYSNILLILPAEIICLRKFYRRIYKLYGTIKVWEGIDMGEKPYQSHTKSYKNYQCIKVPPLIVPWQNQEVRDPCHQGLRRGGGAHLFGGAQYRIRKLQMGKSPSLSLMKWDQ